MPGTIIFRVEDELTYWDPQKPLVLDTSIVLTDATTGEQVDGVIIEEDEGVYTLTNVPAGLYRIEVSADGRSTMEVLVEVDDGEVVDLPFIFLQRSDVSYTWTVTPTEDGEVFVELDGDGSPIEVPNNRYMDLSGIDVLEGVPEIRGNFNAQTVVGSSGDDRITLRGGDDVIEASPGQDTLRLGSGDDYAEGGADADRISGGRGFDEVYGGDGNDRIYGGAADDLLYGGDDDDRLYGGTETDILKDGFGRDSLTGGADPDIFILVTDGEDDLITDYEDGLDRLSIEGQSYEALTISDTANGDVSIEWEEDRLLLRDQDGTLDAADLTEADFYFLPF